MHDRSHAGYSVDLTWDRGSNIIDAQDNVHRAYSTGNGLFDVDYTIDALARLAKAEEGNWTGSVINNRTRQQIWELDQVGNWGRVKLDVNGDNAFTGGGEYDDTRTHNLGNELVERDVDTDTSDDYEPVYDKLGNLVDDDGEGGYEFVYDAWGRLRKMLDQSSAPPPSSPSTPTTASATASAGTTTWTRTAPSRTPPTTRGSSSPTTTCGGSWPPTTRTTIRTRYPRNSPRKSSSTTAPGWTGPGGVRTLTL